jgi:transcriptional regulator of arginine metabolism
MDERANDSQERLSVLKKLIREGEASTQEELCQSLRQKKFDVTQSTVSRDLRRIGAIKTTNAEGEIIYRLPEDHRPIPALIAHDLAGLVIEVQANESTIVLHTTPGSASLVAARIDSMRGALGILGTISGDDAIFIAPVSVKKIATVVKKIQDEYL